MNGQVRKRLGVCGLALCVVAAATPPARGADKGPAREDQIVRWIQQLDDDRFAVRETATKHLIEAGPDVIPPLAEAMSSGSLEVRSRAKRVLMKFLDAKDENMQARVKDELTKLTKAGDAAVAAWADGLLAADDVVSITGTLSNNDPFDRIRGGCRCQVHVRKMKAGRVYQIDMQAGFDTYIRVENAAGANLAMDDDGGEGLNSRLLFTAPQTGDYRVIATSFSGNSVGPYTLTIARKN